MATFFDHINTEMIKQQLGRGYTFLGKQKFDLDFDKLLHGKYGTAIVIVVILVALVILYGFIYLLFNSTMKRCYTTYLGIPTGDGLSSHSRRVSNARLVNRAKTPRMVATTIETSYDSDDEEYIETKSQPKKKKKPAGTKTVRRRRAASFNR